MRTALILFFSLIFAGLPLMVVQAGEAQFQTEQAGVESTSIDNSADSTVDSIVDRSADAKSLFEGRCQMCHQLPEPDMLRPKQWRLILGTMQQRMQQAGVPPLTEVETEMVLEHIAAQSR